MNDGSHSGPCSTPELSHVLIRRAGVEVKPALVAFQHQVAKMGISMNEDAVLLPVDPSIQVSPRRVMIMRHLWMEIAIGVSCE